MIPDVKDMLYSGEPSSLIEERFADYKVKTEKWPNYLMASPDVIKALYSHYDMPVYPNLGRGISTMAWQCVYGALILTVKPSLKNLLYVGEPDDLKSYDDNGYPWEFTVDIEEVESIREAEKILLGDDKCSPQSAMSCANATSEDGLLAETATSRSVGHLTGVYRSICTLLQQVFAKTRFIQNTLSKLTFLK